VEKVKSAVDCWLVRTRRFGERAIIDLPRAPMDDLRNLICVGWRASSPHYICKDYTDLPTVIVSLAAIEPPPRRDEGFDVSKLRRLATGIA
jgi:hypothetical protein